MKPFFIYTYKNSLYIKKLNQNKRLLIKNVYTYTVNVDENDNINIFCIDNFGKLIYISNINSKWKRRTLCKVFNLTKNIENIKCYNIKNQFNLFITEKYHILDNSYKITHINLEKNKYNNLKKYSFKNIIKTNSIYKINIDKYDNIIFEYTYKNIDNTFQNKLIFNYPLKSWTPIKNTNQNIKYNIKRYSNKLIYKI